MENYFISENIKKINEPEFSDSKKYKLIVTTFKTKTGCWGYSKGIVYKDDQIICEIKRNFESFPFLFIENHKNGHDYLICGEDYQGQTILELDTGNKINYLPEEANSGCGFCGVEYKFDPQSSILIVSGCIWGGPYEYKFIDFSNPMEWTQIQCDEFIEADFKWPKINNNIIHSYITEKNKHKSVLTFKLENLKLIKMNEWISDEEQKYRIDQQEKTDKYDKSVDDFKSKNSLYLQLLEELKDPIFSPESYCAVGQTYNNWCPGFNEIELRMIKTIQKDPKIILEFGFQTSPIKLIIGKEEIIFKEHSVQSIKEACQYAKDFLENYSER